MKRKKFEALGKIDDEGQLKIYNKQGLSDWCSENPNQRVRFEVKLMSGKNSSGLRGYYWVEVAPKLNQCLTLAGYHMTDREAHQYFKQFSPVMQQEVELGDKTTIRLRSFQDEDFSDQERREHIDFLKQLCAEEFGVIINDPQ